MKKELKYYNENDYILERRNGPSYSERKELQDNLLIQRSRYHAKMVMYQTKYADLLNDYNYLISLTQKLIEELNLCHDSIDYSNLFNYLLVNHYFSIDKFTSEFQENLFEFEFKYALNVILGQGVCRHTSDLYTDIMNKFFQTSPFVCVESSAKKFGKNHNKRANHVINLIPYKDIIFGYDSFNNYFYHFINKEQMEIADYYASSYLTYKPYHEIIYYNKSFYDINENYKLFKKNAHLDNSIIYNIDTKQEKIFSLLNDKISLLNDYKLETHSIKEKIKEKMLIK